MNKWKVVMWAMVALSLAILVCSGVLHTLGAL